MQSPPSELDVKAAELSTFPSIPGRYFALAVLFSMNLLNYVDRYSFFAVGRHIQDDLNIQDDFRFGVLGAAFMIVYTIVSPLIGWLGDRYSRRHMISFGVGLWSVATVGTAFSRGFNEMFFWRALLGVGEATYGVIAPALLADLFPPKSRGRVIGTYFLALPLGGALGYAIGGWVGDLWGWRISFWVVGLPGITAAAAGLFLHDPGRGASEGIKAGAKERPRFREYAALFSNRSFLLNTAGMAAVTFASGAYAAWGSTFYQTVRGMTASKAGAWIGGLTAGAGLIGILLGTSVSEILLRFTRKAYLLMACIAVMIAIPFGTFGILDPHWASSLGILFVAMIMLASVLGPCNTVTANVVPANQRAAGYALSIFLIHLFGDISSPILIGLISDLCGKPAISGSILGQILAGMGAVPVGTKNLTAGMLSVVPVLVLGCLFFLFGSRHLAADQDRARKAGEGDPLEEMIAH
jgi:MFS family permease